MIGALFGFILYIAIDYIRGHNERQLEKARKDFEGYGFDVLNVRDHRSDRYVKGTGLQLKTQCPECAISCYISKRDIGREVKCLHCGVTFSVGRGLNQNDTSSYLNSKTSTPRSSTQSDKSIKKTLAVVLS